MLPSIGALSIRGFVHEDARYRGIQGSPFKRTRPLAPVPKGPVSRATERNKSKRRKTRSKTRKKFRSSHKNNSKIFDWSYTNVRGLQRYRLNYRRFRLMTWIIILLRPLLGLVSLLLGVFFAIVPIPLGLPFLLVGAVLLSPEIKPLKRLIEWIERRDPTKGKHFSRYHRQLLRFFRKDDHGSSGI